MGYGGEAPTLVSPFPQSGKGIGLRYDKTKRFSDGSEAPSAAKHDKINTD